MRGHKRFNAGAWGLTVNAKDPVTGKRQPVYATVHAPNKKRGEAKADCELAKLVVQVETGRTMPTTGTTVDQLIERYIDDRVPSWASGADGETHARVAQHSTPHAGSMTIGRLRPVDSNGSTPSSARPACPRARSAGCTTSCEPRSAGPSAWISCATLQPRWSAQRGSKPDINPPAPAEVVRIITEASEPRAVFLRLGAPPGARRGKLCRLRWSDIDLDAAVIRWTRSLSKVPVGTVVTETKTRARWSVSLDPATVELLRAHRRRAPEIALAAGAQLPGDAHVFARDPLGQLPWHCDGASQRFAALRNKLTLV